MQNYYTQHIKKVVFIFSSTQGINLKVPVEITNDVIEVCKT